MLLGNLQCKRYKMIFVKLKLQNRSETTDYAHFGKNFTSPTA